MKALKKDVFSILIINAYEKKVNDAEYLVPK